MQIVVPQKDLDRVLDLVARAAGDDKSNLLALAHIRLEARAETLRLSATNLTSTIHITMPAKVEEPGVTLIPKYVGKIAHAMPEGDLRVAVGGSECKLTVSSLGSKRLFNAHGLPGHDWPDPNHGKANLKEQTLPVSTLLLLLKVVEKSISTDEGRIHVNSAQLRWHDSTIEAISTDGHRLTRICRDREAGGTGDVLLSLRSVGILMKVLEQGLKEGAKDCLVFSNDRTFGVKLKDTEFVTKTVEAAFPPWQQIVTGNWGTKITLRRTEFIDATKAADVADDQHKTGVKMVLNAARKLTLTIESPVTGVSHDEIEPLDVAMGRVDSDVHARVLGRYLREATEHMDGEEVVMGIRGPLDAIFLTPKDDWQENPAMCRHFVCVMGIRD